MTVSKDDRKDADGRRGPQAGGHVRPRGKGARGRLFTNDFMERMTRVSPNVALGTYVPIAMALVVVNFWQGHVPSVLYALVLFLAGVVVWTFFEYLAHRYVFHLVSESERLKKFSYTIHGVHHEFPRDHGRLFMPPPVGLTVAAILFGLIYLVLGGRTFMFFSGFMMGYVGYAYIHYCIHRYRPPRMLKFLWRHHLQHHYKCPELAYGVSSPVWDLVFRTMPPAEPAKTRLEEEPDRALQA